MSDKLCVNCGHLVKYHDGYGGFTGSMGMMAHTTLCPCRSIIPPAAPISESEKCVATDCSSRKAVGDYCHEHAISESETPPPQDIEKWLNDLRGFYLDDAGVARAIAAERAILDSFSRLTRERDEARELAELRWQTIQDGARGAAHLDAQNKAVTAELSELRKNTLTPKEASHTLGFEGLRKEQDYPCEVCASITSKLRSLANLTK